MAYYGQPPPGYPPPAGYPPPPGYGAPPSGYPQSAGFPPPAYPPAGYPPPSGYPQPGYPPQPGYGAPAYGAPVAYGPQSQAPDPAVQAYVAQTYAQVAADGRVDANEVIRICQAYQVACDQTTAAQILTAAAGPMRAITKDTFVYHVSLYITRNRRY
ncbi:MAG: hypothetical protein EZS28_021273 [Streblomastix strix]|uniref:Uncharacterized protein n=1 Tax=Streblomastix strix TaxID=222440 RepID=A0A5J4VLH2_9EUKA|nr:MAG: hypothetical protein EZS28_021273 [Streblomastix strix]